MLTIATILLSTALVAGVKQDTPARRDTTARADTALVRADTSAPARTLAIPILSWSEVTGVQFGVTVLRGFRVGDNPSTRTSSAQVYLSRTGKAYTKAYLQLDRWADGNESRIRLRGDYIDYPLPYYGTGSDTPNGSEEWYSSGVTTIQVFRQQQWRRATYVHAGLRFLSSRLRESEPGGMIEPDTLPGASSSVVPIGELGIVIDSRDNPGAALAGTYARIVPSASSKSLGSDFTFRRITMDVRRYQPVGAPGHVLAMQVQYDGIVAGTTPFDQVPMIGADTAMRGYARGRFRDQQAFTAQAEYRTSHWRRLGIVAFVGAGTVASSFADLVTGTWYPTVGVGGRLLLVTKDRLVARGDLAFGRNSLGIHVGIGEAF